MKTSAVVSFLVALLTCVGQHFVQLPALIPGAVAAKLCSPARRRQKMSPGSSRRNFTRHAVKQHKRNFGPHPMRGGIRL